MGFRVSTSMLTSHFKQHCKTSVKPTILDLRHAPLTHRDAPRMHKTYEPHLEGSWVHLGASCWPSWNHLGVMWAPPGAQWERKYAYKTNVN